MKPETTPAVAQQEMTALAADLEREYPETNRDVRFVLQELRENVAGAVREPLIILLATVAFVLLIACVNVANLLIAKGARAAERTGGASSDRRQPRQDRAPGPQRERRAGGGGRRSAGSRWPGG